MNRVSLLGVVAFLAFDALPSLAARNVILFIGDGMGFEHVQAGRLYMTGSDTKPLSFETLLYRGKAVTRLPDGTVTDSATAATALATGYQHPVNGVISMGADNSIKTTILELAQAKGFRTGIITTDSISGATPAAFGAHEPSRAYEADIRYDYLMDDTTYLHPASRPNLLFGGGFNDPYLIPGPNQTYVGIASLLGYKLVDTAGALDVLGSADYALGLFGTSWAPMASSVAHNSTQPRLPHMVSKALTLLQNEGGPGFFLMVEGALIDKLSHSNDRNFALEVAELDLAVQEAFAWADQSGQEVLVIVTADHETGGLNVPDGQSLTPGTIPSLTFSSTGHTGADVPVYANWPAALQGQTIDNTEIFYLMEDYLEGGKAPQVTDLSVSEITETSATVTWNTLELSDSQVVLSGAGGSFVSPARVVDHAVVCNGLQSGTTYNVTASSADLAGYTGSATAQFTTPSSADAVVIGKARVVMGNLSGKVDGVAAPNDGITQRITETADGPGCRLQVEFTLHTPVSPIQIASLRLYGLVSWTLKDGASDNLVTEIRVIAPGGVVGWERIAMDSQNPFQAVPPSSYVDAKGNVVLRFSDSASIKRERKDTLTVDYLVGKIDRAPGPVSDPTVPMDVTSAALNRAPINPAGPGWSGFTPADRRTTKELFFHSASAAAQ